MKKYLLSLAILVAVSISAKAQFDLGVKGGMNLSSINTDNLDKSTKTGYQAGIFARFGSSFYIQPEAYVAGTGSNFRVPGDNTSFGNVTFTTLNVPLLLGHEFGTTSTNFRIMAGPVYSYNMNTHESFSDNFNAAYHDFGHYNNSTIGYQAGVGIDLLAFTADLRYEGGLSKLNSAYGQRANIWSLSIGFKIL